MPLVLNEEQNMLKDSARDFCSKKMPITQLRKLRDSRDETGFSRESWQEMVELGWAGIAIPEALGGLGFGYLGLGVVMEEMGRTLAASPMMSTAVLGATAIQLAGTDEQQSSLLPQIASGDLITALCMEEGPHHRATGFSSSANRTADGYSISGSKQFVLDGHVADQLIVVAVVDGEAGLFLVDGTARGVTRKRTFIADSRNAANISFDQAPGQRLGSGDAADALERVLDTGRIALAAEMLGGSLECFERTLEYLKTREQFGVPIGSFQALKHRAAQMFCEVELSRSVVMEALSALDESASGIGKLASLAKARLTDTYNLVSSEGVQMHGGIGMTDEHEIGFFMKRARVCEHTLGNAAFHRNRYGELEGY